MIDADADYAVEIQKAERAFRLAEEERQQREAVIAARRAELIAEEQRELQGVRSGTLEIQPAESSAPQTTNTGDSGGGMNFRGIAIVAGLVVLLLVLWISERRGRRSS